MKRLSRQVSLVSSAVVCLCVAAPSPANGAAVVSRQLAELPGAAEKLVAYHGYVIFSQAEKPGRWRLMSWHRGVITRLNAPARRLPFDAEVGPATNGSPEVVFSKCALDPSYRAGQVHEQQATEWWRAIGCRIYRLMLPNGLAVPIRGIWTPPGYSDTTPAIWNGNVAFARHRSAPRSTRLYIWHHGDRSTTLLGGGPRSCPAGVVCSQGGRVTAAWVNSIDLDAQAASYEWIAQATNSVSGLLAEPEIRLDPLRDGVQSGLSKVVSNTFFRGTCGGYLVGSPSLAGEHVLYERNLFECERAADEEISNRFVWFLEEHVERQAPAPGYGVAVALAWDHGTAYWIRDQLPPENHCQEPGTSSCEEVNRMQEHELEASCTAGFAACGGSVFGQLRGCAPAQGRCTLMATTNLQAPARRRPAH